MGKEDVKREKWTWAACKGRHRVIYFITMDSANGEAGSETTGQQDNGKRREDDVMPLTPEKQALANDFQAWLKKHGGTLHPDLYIAEHKRMGMGVFAKANLDAEIDAINVPTNVCITPLLAKARITNLLGMSIEAVESSDCLFDEEKCWILLYLYMHKQLLSKKDDAAWNDEARPFKRSRCQTDLPVVLSEFLEHVEYVQLLPEDVKIPSMYQIDEVKLLRGTPLYFHAVHRRTETRRQCFRVLRWLNRQVRMMGGPSASMIRDCLYANDVVLEDISRYSEAPRSARTSDKSDKEDEWNEWGSDENENHFLNTWRWADSVYVSRAFPPRVINGEGNTPILIPGYDLFNHARQSKVTWMFDGRASEQDHVKLTLHYPLRAGIQATNTYGPRPNEELLASYGFVEKSMIDDTVTIKLNNSPKQHYWRYRSSLPETLFEEVQQAYTGSDAFQSDVAEFLEGFSFDDVQKRRALISRFGERVAVLDVITSMLEAKQETFYLSQRDVDNLLMTEECKRRRTMSAYVIDCVSTYREGQRLTLAWAIASIREEVNENVESALAELKRSTSYGSGGFG